MNLTFKIPDGRTFTEEYETPQAFIADQLADFDTIPDAFEVTTLEIEGKTIDFNGNIGQLYDFLSQK